MKKNHQLHYKISQTLNKYKAFRINDCKSCKIGVLYTESYGDFKPFDFTLEIFSDGEERDFEINDWTFSRVIQGHSNGNDFNPLTRYTINWISPEQKESQQTIQVNSTQIDVIITDCFDRFSLISSFKSQDEYEIIDSLDSCFYDDRNIDSLCSDFRIFLNAINLMKDNAKTCNKLHDTIRNRKEALYDIIERKLKLI